MESKRHASPVSELMPDEKRQKHDDGGEQKTEQISLSCTETKDEQMQGSSSTAEVQTSDDIKERIDQDDEQKVNKAECSGNGNINSQIAGDAVNITVPDRWQTSCRSMKDRMAKLYKSSFLTDCVFIVGDVNVKEYRLHALILSMASPVFEDLLSDVNNRVIKITDVESEVFDQILEYIYLDLLHLESVEKTQALYRAAQKLKLTLIIERAVQLMMGSMNFDNIWPTLESAQITCDMILRAECLKYFKKHTRELLKHPKFTTVDRSVVQDLVSEEVLEGILEVELVAGVISWAKAQCEKNNMANNLENKREFLGNEIISKLRFLNLPQISFVKEAASTSSKPDDSILTREESYAILLNLIVPGIEPLPDIVCKESKLRIAGKLRVTRKVMPSAGFPPPFTLPFPAAQFDKMVVLPNPTPISPFGAKSFCCDIVVSYPIKLIGIQAPTFFSPQNISAEYEENYIVTVQASHTSRNLASTTLKGKVKYNSSIEIIFKDSVLIERNIKYSIFIYTSNMYYVSRTLALHENRPPVQFTFKDTVSYFGAPSNASLVTDFGFLTELIYNL